MISHIWTHMLYLCTWSPYLYLLIHIFAIKISLLISFVSWEVKFPFETLKFFCASCRKLNRKSYPIGYYFFQHVSTVDGQWSKCRRSAQWNLLPHDLDSCLFLISPFYYLLTSLKDMVLIVLKRVNVKNLPILFLLRCGKPRNNVGYRNYFDFRITSLLDNFRST